MRAGMNEIRPESGGRKYDGRIKQRNRAENTQNQRTSDCPAVSRFLPFVFCLSLFLFLDSILIGNHQKTETVTSVVDNLSP